MDPALWELVDAGSDDDEVSVILRLADVSRPPDKVRIVARFGNIVTARLQRGDIRRVWENDLVISMKASRPVVAPLTIDEALDEDAALLAADPSATATSPRTIPEDGTGVIVGVCDWGMDLTHPNFRNADGTTRLAALWDQRGTGGQTPEPYRYGRVHTRADIDAALAQPDPFAALGYDLHGTDRGNQGTHGTHVCDILAGNRRVPGSTAGMAPGAEIVFVQLTSQHMEELADFGDSVYLLEALDFVRKTAGSKPCVINLSAGKTGGEHRGTNPFEQAVDAMLTGQDGIALVQSAGNYGNTAMHTHARLGPDQRHVLKWIVRGRDRTPNELEIWYSGQDRFEVTLVSPQGQRFSVSLGDKLRIQDDGQHWGNFYHRRLEPNSHHNHVDIFLRATAPAGCWQIELVGREVVDGRLHAWIERDVGGHHQSRFARDQATASYTTNTICNSLRGIAVGAYDATATDRPPTRFTSRGPTADGRQKPELVAPGYRIRAARSMPAGGWRPGEPQLTVKSGTSMASPHVAGTVALMYQAAGRPLSIHEVRRVLIGTADPHPGPPGRSSTQLGYGYLNPEAAVAAVRRPTSERTAPAVGPALTEVARSHADAGGSGEAGRRTASPGDEGFGDEGFGDGGAGDEDFGDEDFGDEGLGDEGLGDEGLGDEDGTPAPPPAAVTASAGHDLAGDGFSYPIDELGLDAEAAFRPRRSPRAPSAAREGWPW
jgi:subtilisin family serine protease